MFIPSRLGGDIIDVIPGTLSEILCDVKESAYNERDYEKFSTLVTNSKKPLYPGYKPKHTKLYDVLDHMKLNANNGWPRKSFSELF